MTNADKFHAHLDACERCRTQPFNLCATGARLLEKVGDDLDETRMRYEAATDVPASLGDLRTRGAR